LEEINFYSDQMNSAEVRKDFEKLIGNWRSKEALSDNKDDGFVIKARELLTRDGKIVFRQTGILQDLASVDGFKFEDSRITWTLESQDEQIVQANGKVLSTVPPSVTWPSDAPEIRLRLRRPLRESFKTSQPQMMQLLADYLAAQARIQGAGQ